MGRATEGAAPDDAAAAPSTATRQAPPAPPIKYLEAGAKLFNSQEFDQGRPSTWRRPIVIGTCSVRTSEKMLDAYLAELAKVQQAGLMPAVGAVRPVARGDGTRGRGGPARRPRHPIGRRGPGDGRPHPPRPSAANPAAMPTSPAEAKQRGRWLLHEGREQLLRGQLRRRPAEGRRGPDAGRPLGAVRRHAREARAGDRQGPPAGRRPPRRHGRREPAPRPPDGQGQAAARPATLLDSRPVRAGRGPRAGSEDAGGCPTACSRTIPTR